MNIRHLSKLATGEQVLEAHGAQNRSVPLIREESSTGATKQLPPVVELRKMSIIEKLEDAKDLADIAAYDASSASSEEAFPLELVERLLLSGESKIRIMRECRSYSATHLAKAIDISESYLSQIEHKKRKGTIDFYSKCAKYLDIDIELLVD